MQLSVDEVTNLPIQENNLENFRLSMADFDSICPQFTGFLGPAFKAVHPDEFGPDGRVKVCIGGGAGFIGSHIAKKLRQEVSRLLFWRYLILSKVF
jgi:hypothetical protein